MLEIVLLAAGMEVAASDSAAPPDAPSIEMLEFLGDWSEDEAAALDPPEAAQAEEMNRIDEHEDQPNP